MISLIFFSLAAICNAVMDTLVHHYYVSVFRKMKNSSFWNPEKSWLHAIYLPHTKYKLDAWHLFKSGMIVMITLSIITFDKYIIWFNAWWFYSFILIIYGTIWNLTFNLFYNKILRK